MARPSKYAAMSVEALIDLRGKVTQELAQRSKQLQAQLEHIGGHTNGVRQSNRNDRHSPLKGKKAEIKYRGPERGQTWAGRGLPPKWLTALVKAGHRIEQYAVGRAAAAARKPATKRSAGRKAKRKAKAK